MLLELIILPIIFMLSLIITIEDFRFSKIRNKWIKLGILIGVIYYVVLLIFSILGNYNVIQFNYYRFDYYLFVFLNTLLSFVFAFTIWNLRLWAGGDAKLFSLYAFLIPLNFYATAYFKYWPSLSLLINIIIPIFLYLVIKMIFYPFKVGFNYLKNPQLLKEYYQEYKEKNKIDKAKIKEFFITVLSFFIILILFQLLRYKLMDLLTPYLGTMVTASYFLISILIFKPMREILKKYVIIVAVFVVLYFVIGGIYFREQVFADLHKIFALQIILMMSYFYIFKYGKIIGKFLYNSTEVKMIPIVELAGGEYINKNHIKQIMGSRTNLNKFKKEVANLLQEEEKKDLWVLIKQKTDKESREKKQMRYLAFLRMFKIRSLPQLFQNIYELKRQKNIEKYVLNTVSPKLSEQQKKELNYILKNSDEVQEFLKTIKGKLTQKQAEDLKMMIEKRNKEITREGHPSIDNIILHKTFSFAPFMLLGLIITIMTKSSIIHLIYEYILHR